MWKTINKYGTDMFRTWVNRVNNETGKATQVPSSLRGQVCSISNRPKLVREGILECTWLTTGISIGHGFQPKLSGICSSSQALTFNDGQQTVYRHSFARSSFRYRIYRVSCSRGKLTSSKPKNGQQKTGRV